MLLLMPLRPRHPLRLMVLDKVYPKLVLILNKLCSKRCMTSTSIEQKKQYTPMGSMEIATTITVTTSLLLLLLLCLCRLLLIHICLSLVHFYRLISIPLLRFFRCFLLETLMFLSLHLQLVPIVMAQQQFHNYTALAALAVCVRIFYSVYFI